MTIKRLLITLSFLSILIGCVDQSQSGIVSVEGGQLQGVPTDNPEITIFKGVPYAAPPVGENRWREPQPVIPWEGVKVADTFGPISVQDVPNMSFLFAPDFHMDQPITSEDCLYLNVWVPTKTIGDKKASLPVALWIHGGGYSTGFGNDFSFNGQAWAERGVILVTINYRLGALGFLSHPELSKETGHGSSGNWGIYDQLCALKWVKNNIQEFGGDPNNITLFGQSAGAASVKTLSTSPLAKGLFAKAIIQSGGGMGVFMGGNQTNEQIEQQSKEILDNAGLNTLEKMRSADVQTIMSLGLRGGAVTDGKIITESFDEAVRNNDIMDIPYMIGSNGDDIYDMTPGCEEFCQIREKNGGSNTYLYLFDRKNGGSARHSMELWYMFDSLTRTSLEKTDHDMELVDQMMTYWTNFAKYSDPSPENHQDWKAYTAEDPFMKLLK